MMRNSWCRQYFNLVSTRVDNAFVTDIERNWAEITTSRGVPCELPPLILHPFDQRSSADESCQDTDCNPLSKQYLEARYHEFRMICLLGKDLNRWLEQCVETAARDPKLAGMAECNFVAILLFAPPVPVIQKMRLWGVRNFQLIFSRAIGLNAVFPNPPSANEVSESFLRRYHKYADALYDARRNAEEVPETQGTFTFEIYSSDEYTLHLERIWGE